eukprot:TRINITY_DN28893_c0_g2_i1.p1 TRINITY_DN28893_c0_g2~~TRINITY_DN28893_c0_g2_i1.p1  ORF type:complete len:395 (+),score=62.53 TRINITY_DN28893_c0_g2_i1:154-1185(+)
MAEVSPLRKLSAAIELELEAIERAKAKQGKYGWSFQGRSPSDLKLYARELGEHGVTLVRDPHFQTVTVAIGTGAVTFAAVGGAFGCATGIVTGSAAGVLPALFTLGMSIPVGAAIGSGVGLCAGATAGAALGAAAGYGAAHKYSVQIRNGVLFVQRKAVETVHSSRAVARRSLAAASSRLDAGHGRVKLIVDGSSEYAKAKAAGAVQLACRGRDSGLEFGCRRSVQVTSASAVAGGVVGGGAGGATGLVVGAAVGVVPAVFTFGLSIPICATVGACTGAVGGSAVGAVSGGAAGYQVYAQRARLARGSLDVCRVACDSVETAKARATDSLKSFARSWEAVTSL